MANKFKNEKEIKIGGESILLRPTFENLANMESKVGSIAHMAMKLVNFNNGMKNVIGISEIATIIFYNQAANDPDFGTKPKSIGAIYDLVLEEGFYLVIPPLAEYVGGVTRGNKLEPELSEAQKKS